jgi:transposase
MSQNNNPILHTGLDIAKLSLELDLAGKSHPLANDAKAHAQLLKLLRRHPNPHVVCEATGGYEQPVVRFLQAEGIPVSVVEPSRVRHHARALGRRAKTDPMDAAVLSHFGATCQPAPTPPPSQQQQKLADLVQRRSQLLDLIMMERNHAEHYSDAFRIKQTQQLQKVLTKQIDACEEAIAQLIDADEQLKQKAARLDDIPGVGPIVAATVLAEMPELGTLNAQTAAALAGVAPYNNDSGPQKGVRYVGGGRKAARCALYMAALSAVKHDPILKEFYQRLLAAGKKPLVALTACMRKLIVLMNRLLKDEKFELKGKKLKISIAN